MLVSILCCTISQLQAQAQPKLLQGSSLTTQNLNAAQFANYQDLANREFVSSVSLITLNSLSGSSTNGSFKVQLPGNSCGEVTFVTKIAEYVSENQFMWEGEVKNPDTCGCIDGEFFLQSQNGRKLGHVSLDGNYYEIREIGSGQYALAAFSFNDWVGEECITGNNGENISSPSQTSDRDGDHCVVRLLAIYNQSALDSLGSTAAMNDLVYHAFGQTKIALLNSEVTEDELELVLAGIQAVNFPQDTIDAVTAVAALSTNPSVMALRNAAGADIVALISGDDYFVVTDSTGVDSTEIDTSDIRGIVAGILPSEDSAYLIVEHGTATSYHTFAHEVAHIFGCRHQVANPAGDDEPGNMHGYQFNIGTKWCKKMRKTIMHRVYTGDHRITHYSNPGVTYAGENTGTISRENNAQQLRSAACTVAAFRDSNETPLTVTITGKKIGCPCDVVILTAELSGGPSGIYTYEWRVSQDGGINYGGVESTTSTLQTDLPCPDDGVFKVRLKVTDPNGVEVYKYANITASNNPPNGEECGHGGGIIGGGGNKVINSSITVYPNPTSGKTNLAFKKEVAGIVTIKISNLEGEIVRRVSIGYFEAGLSTVELPLEGLPTGFYSINVLDDEGTKSTKLVINNNQ